MNCFTIKTRQKGASIVEFGILLPVFIAIVLGTIELGWALYVQNTLVDSARFGARIAVTQNVTTDSITDQIRDFSRNAGIPNSDNITVDYSPGVISTQPRGTAITVTVSTPHDLVSVLPTSMFLRGATIQGRSIMVKEY